MLGLFDEAVLAHHAEEERELFPAVLASAAAGAEREQVQNLIGRLTAEHRSIESAFRRMAPERHRVAKGQDSALEPSAVQHLVAHEQARARFEEAEFLPLAQAILGRNRHHLEALELALHLRHGPRVVGGGWPPLNTAVDGGRCQRGRRGPRWHRAGRHGAPKAALRHQS